MRIYPFNLDIPDNVPYARFSFIQDGRRVPDFSCLISVKSAGSMTRAGEGESPARAALWSVLGIDPRFVHAPAQTHSREVLVAQGPAGRVGEADGLASADPACFLSVTVADCLPIYLLDTEHGAFALLHSGWKGTGIVNRALEMMAAHWQTRAPAVAAVLGPCISGASYAVDPARAEAFDAEFGGSGGSGGSDGSAGSGGSGGEYPLGPVVDRRRFIDLQAANARLLAAAGVGDVAVCRDCTYRDERLGSFRREGKETYTRMAAVVGRL